MSEMIQGVRRFFQGVRRFLLQKRPPAGEAGLTPLGGLFLLFLTMRFGHILTGLDAIADPEECLTGAIGYDLLLGAQAPLWDYQLDAYSGGTLVNGLLASLFFSGLGPSMFALKLVPLLFSSAVFLLTLWAAARFFNFEAAAGAGLLILFASPAFIAASHYAMGSHCESVLFSLLQIVLALELQQRPSRKKLMMLGLISGFGFWYAYLTVFSGAACLLMLLLDPGARRCITANKYSGIAAVLAGLIPWLAFNLWHRWEGVSFIGMSLQGNFFPVSEYLNGFMKRFLELWFHGLPQSFGFQSSGPVPARILNSVYFICLAAAAGLSVRSGGAAQSLFRIVFFYALLFSTAYALTGLPPEFRYFFPLSFILILAAAAAPVRNSVLSRGLKIVLLSLGLSGQGLFLFSSPPGEALDLKGYCHFEYSGNLEKSLLSQAADPAGKLSLISRYIEEQRPYSFQVMSYETVAQAAVKPEGLAGFLPAVPENVRPFFLKVLEPTGMKTIYCRRPVSGRWKHLFLKSTVIPSLEELLLRRFLSPVI
jgi:hypothetical protein